MEQEESHKNNPRRGWARTHMGNLRPIAVFHWLLPLRGDVLRKTKQRVGWLCRDFVCGYRCWNPYRFPRLLCISISGLIAILGLSNAPGLEYEIEGRIAGSNGKGEETDPVQFHLYFKDCNWLMHCTPESPGMFSDHINYWEFGCHNGTLYGLVKQKQVQGRKPTWLGDVKSEAAPRFRLLPQITVAWFAFASQCYLDSTNNYILPPYSTDPVRVPQRAIVVRTTEDPQLPLYCAFLSDGIDRRFEQLSPYPPPFNNGFTNAIFEVLAFTNVNGRSFPEHINCQVFGPSPQGLQTIFSCRAVVERVRTLCTLKSLLPSIPYQEVGEVKDFRFVSADARQQHEFVYRTSKWLETAEVRLLPDFTNYAKWEPEVNKLPQVARTDTIPSGPATSESRLIRRATMGLLAVSTIGTLLYLVKTLKARQTKPTTRES